MMWVAARREVSALFRSPFAWAVLAAVQFLIAYQFLAQIDLFMTSLPKIRSQPHPFGVTQWVVVPTFGVTALLLLMLIPVLTMHTFSGERRAGTLHLWYSAPIRLSALVGTAHEPEIVGVEPRRLVADKTAEARGLTGDLPERERSGVSAQRRRIRIHSQVVGVGALEAVHGVLLHSADRLGVALDVGAREIAGDVVDRRKTPVVIHAAGVGVVGGGVEALGAGLGRDRHRNHVGGLVADAGIADGALVGGQSLRRQVANATPWLLSRRYRSVS